MLVIIAMSVCTVAAFFVTAARVMSVKLLLGYATIVDVAFTVGLLFVFSGTLGGMLIAVLAGLMMAVCLSVMRRYIGYERLAYRHVGPVTVQRKRVQRVGLRLKSVLRHEIRNPRRVMKDVYPGKFAM